MSIRYHFQGSITELLRNRWQEKGVLEQPFIRTASIKDVIEAFGPPHTEIGYILCNSRPVDFNWLVAPGQEFEIGPISAPWDVTSATLLRPSPLPSLKFCTDLTVGRLTRYLRMAGFDTLYTPGQKARALAASVHEEQRVLLTKNLGLLKYREVEFGRAIRAVSPDDQLREVLNLFGIDQLKQPLSRCLACNRLLEPVEKETILHRLEPLTLRYYSEFFVCQFCDTLFWPGSHVERMRTILNEFT
ncbi:MAG: Mut7-C RNAse domain-containing protein [Desulfobulbus oligotrophicus]|jgi:uncharacterized protein with PIN domain|nr:Mut7-C RNAse domain-containing protein [Desulfobulbus oligotrophicus]